MAVALALKQWTLEELHSLPDDGNTYELIDGELFVTPAPAPGHQEILARLSAMLTLYVSEQRLGCQVYHPRSVLQRNGSQVEPDLMVRKPMGPGDTWDTAPIPILVVEVHSPYTRRRDTEQKRAYYKRHRVAEYWMIDPEERTVTIVRAGKSDVVVTDEVTWHPKGAAAPLLFDARSLLE